MKRDTGLQTGGRDTRAGQRQSRLPRIKADDCRVGEGIAEGYGKAGDTGSDIENPYAAAADSGFEKQGGDDTGCETLRLQDRRVGMSPCAGAIRFLHQIKRLTQTRSRERKGDRPVPIAQIVQRIPCVKRIDNSVELCPQRRIARNTHIIKTKTRRYRGKGLGLREKPADRVFRGCSLPDRIARPGIALVPWRRDPIPLPTAPG